MLLWEQPHARGPGTRRPGRKGPPGLWHLGTVTIGGSAKWKPGGDSAAANPGCYPARAGRASASIATIDAAARLWAHVPVRTAGRRAALYRCLVLASDINLNAR